MEFMYFTVMAKGLGPVLALQFSGLEWKGNKDTGFDASKHWGGLKKSGKCPFGQLPLLETEEGLAFSQTTAILNYVARKCKHLEGANDKDFVTSQMLMAEGEDLYTNLQRWNPTLFVALGQRGKGDLAACNKFWTETVPDRLANLEKLAAKGFSSATTVGELHLFGYLHQMMLCHPKLLSDFACLRAWYCGLLEDPRTQAVLKGESSFGEIRQYFINPSAAGE